MPNPKWLKSNHLNSHSHPAKWFDAFIPTKLTDTWTSYTNIKAMRDNAGQRGKPYPDYKPFTTRELRQHIGVYIQNGISPSPNINKKFKSQNQESANGNDFIFRSLGPNASRRHRHFQRYFGVQDPLKPVPTRKTHPLWKVEEFLKSMNDLNQAAWLLGKKLSVDEQTIGFKGRHADKLRITYKKEGDGFQCDALCDDGFTYAFYF